MADTPALAASVRTEFGKGFARRLRAAGQIPAVVYGHGKDPVHVALPAHDTGLIVRRANALIELDVEGRNELVLVKDVQRDPVRQIIEHMDLVIVNRGEKMQVAVPYVTEGETFPGTIHTLAASAITVEAEATQIPEHIVIDVEGLEDGAMIHAGDITLPKGVELAEDPELLLVSVETPRGEEEPEDEESEEGAEAEEGGEESSEEGSEESAE